MVTAAGTSVPSGNVKQDARSKRPPNDILAPQGATGKTLGRGARKNDSKKCAAMLISLEARSCVAVRLTRADPLTTMRKSLQNQSTSTLLFSETLCPLAGARRNVLE
jgi:hypothetical protein